MYSDLKNYLKNQFMFMVYQFSKLFLHVFVAQSVWNQSQISTKFKYT